MKELASIREVAYRFLALIFLYPEQHRLDLLRELAQYFLQDSRLNSLVFWPTWKPLCKRLWASSNGILSTLSEEYVWLFGVAGRPDACWPYASWYMGTSPNLVVEELHKEYCSIGMIPAGPNPADHISVQLEFMSVLVGREQKAWESDVATALEAVSQEERFLCRYLQAWIPKFCSSITRDSDESVYLDAAVALEAFIQHEVDLTASFLTDTKDL